MKNLKMKVKILWSALVLVAVVGIGFAVRAYSGSSQIVVESGGTVNAYQSGSIGSEEMIGATPIASNASHLSQTPKPTALGATYFSGDIETDGAAYLDSTLTVAGATSITGALSSGALTYKESSVNTSAGTTTLTAADSGKTYYISGATTTIVLPATSSAITGVTYRFVIGGALTVTSTIITPTGANEIEGALIVAGAVVDCDAEDTLTFGASFENIGDYLDLTFSGTYWMLGDSGALTGTALTCTAT